MTKPQRKAFRELYIRVRVSRFGPDPNSGVRELKNNGALDHPPGKKDNTVKRSDLKGLRSKAFLKGLV